MGLRTWIYQKTRLKLKKFDTPKNTSMVPKDYQQNIAATVQLSNFKIEKNVDIGDYTYFVGSGHVYTNTTIGRYCSIGAGLVSLETVTLTERSTRSSSCCTKIVSLSSASLITVG